MWSDEAYINKSATIRRVESKRRKHFAFALKVSRQMLKEMYRPIFEAVRAAKNTDELQAKVEGIVISDTPAKKGIERIYVKVGSDFAKDTADKLVKTKSDNTDYFTTYMRQYVDAYTGNKVTHITDTTKKKALSIVKRCIAEGIEQGLAIDKISALINSRLVNDIGYRAVKIARTEVIGASNAGSLQGAKSLNLKLNKVWFSSKTGHTRQSHQEMDKKIVDINDSFTVPKYDSKGNFLGTEKMQHPGDQNGSAGNVINCRCTLVYERA